MGASIDYRPIPCEEGKGYTALSIYPPGEFIDNKDYAVFVGGGGYGHRATFKSAKAFLLECAKLYCHRRINTARATVAHYERELASLDRDGLKAGKHAR